MMVVKFSHFAEEREQARRSGFPKGCEGAWGWERPIVMAMSAVFLLLFVIGAGSLYYIATDPAYCGNCQWTGIPPFAEIVWDLCIMSIGFAGLLWLFVTGWLV